MKPVPVPILLDRRSAGLFHPNLFSHRILAFNSKWTLSQHRVISVTNRGNCITTTLDLSSSNNEYVLTGNVLGTCCIYHLAEPKVKHHTPLQHAQCPSRGGPTQVAALQWYPVDAGVFVSATVGGSVCVWDTNTMEPVLEIKPFAYRTHAANETIQLQTMRLAPYQPLAAVGCLQSPSIQLVDLRTGGAAHTLTPKDADAADGVCDTQWSPMHPHILASCGRSATLLWDIRRPNLVLTQCCSHTNSEDILVGTNYAWDGSHFRSPSSKGLTTTATSCGATSISFDATGRRLITVDGRERSIDIWDLRHSRPRRQPGHFVDQHNGKPVDRNPLSQPLVVLDDAVYIVRSNQVVQYPLVNDRNGKAMQTPLTAHLGRVQAMTATKSMLVTAADDALVLVWERHHRQKPQKEEDAADDEDTW